MPFRTKLKKSVGAKSGRFLQEWADAQPWNDWWLEFQTKVVDQKGLAFAGTRPFFQEKFGLTDKSSVADQYHYKLALAMTGRRPVPTLQPGDLYDFPICLRGQKKNVSVRVSWLGDWEKQRSQAFRLRGLQGRTLRYMMDERTDALARGKAASRLPLGWLKRFAAVAQQIDDYFGPSLVRSTDTWETNEKRVRSYLQVQAVAMKLGMDALTRYLECHGLRPDAISEMAQMAAIGAKAALAGVATGALAGSTQQGASPLVQTMMEAFAQKAQLYSLPLPEEGDDANVVEVTTASTGVEEEVAPDA